MNEIILTRKQLKKLNEIAYHFKDTNIFTIQSEDVSGIGPSVVVKFDLLEKNDVIVNITDVSEW